MKEEEEAGSTLPRPGHAPHGRESARHLEATRRDAGEQDEEGDDAEEERDLSRRRAEEAALYMDGGRGATRGMEPEAEEQRGWWAGVQMADVERQHGQLRDGSSHRSSCAAGRARHWDWD